MFTGEGPATRSSTSTCSTEPTEAIYGAALIEFAGRSLQSASTRGPNCRRWTSARTARNARRALRHRERATIPTAGAGGNRLYRQPRHANTSSTMPYQSYLAEWATVRVAGPVHSTNDDQQNKRGGGPGSGGARHTKGDEPMPNLNPTDGPSRTARSKRPAGGIGHRGSAAPLGTGLPDVGASTFHGRKRHRGPEACPASSRRMRSQRSPAAKLAPASPASGPTIWRWMIGNAGIIAPGRSDLPLDVVDRTQMAPSMLTGDHHGTAPGRRTVSRKTKGGERSRNRCTMRGVVEQVYRARGLPQALGSPWSLVVERIVPATTMCVAGGPSGRLREGGRYPFQGCWPSARR